jgi:hypothetical protein
MNNNDIEAFNIILVSFYASEDYKDYDINTQKQEKKLWHYILKLSGTTSRAATRMENILQRPSVRVR